MSAMAKDMNTKARPEGLDQPYVKKIINNMSRANVWLYQKTGGLLGSKWRVGSAFPWGVPVCLLTTTGRKSGQQRTTPLLYIENDGDIIVVASTGGLPKNPGWYYNIKANPSVMVQIKRERQDCVARVASSEERAELWPKLVAHYADFANYEAWTERTIPVVVLSRA